MTLEAFRDAGLDAEFRFDAMSRALYSTDASIYRIEPLGVAIPRSVDAVQRIVRLAWERGVPILPRGAGTSLAGQTVGRALVLDLSKHLDRILEVNAAGRWVRVEPGVVQDDLNRALAPHGLLFGPDTATSAQATIGGMVGNNSSGARSILYGLTVHHVLELDAVLADGTRTTLGALPRAEARRRGEGTGIEADAWRTVLGAADACGDEIERRYPKILRRVAGYNLDRMRGDPVNLAEIVVGSEGTLAVVVGAKLRLVERPRATGLDVLHFRDMDEALRAAQVVLGTGPAAVELVDDMILDLCRANLELSRKMGWVIGRPGSILIVEYHGDDAALLAEKMAALKDALGSAGFDVPARRALDAARMADVWKIRKAGLPLLLGLPGDAKPVAFVEDTAVDPRHLPEYIRRFRAIVEAHGTRAGFFAHASVGCIHVRPVLDLRTESGVAAMRSISRQVADLVKEYGGAMSGEHGDGLSRGVYVREFFGPVLHDAVRRIKRAFDPRDLLNPGKIVDPPPIDENLRYGPGYRTSFPAPRFAYERAGGFARAVELCNGAGVCRKHEGGAMCPSFQVTRDEEDTTRARANALREAIAGRLPPEELLGERMGEVLDLCVSCKSCKSECPSNVDLARLKSEWLAWRHDARGAPLASRFAARLPALLSWANVAPDLVNALGRNRGLRRLAEVVLGVDRRRPAPRLARRTFSSTWRARRFATPPEEADLLYFADTFTEFLHPEVGSAAVEVLAVLGWRVALAPRLCCQRPAISLGFLDRARRGGEALVAALLPHARAGRRIAFTEPSCWSALSDDLPALLATPEAAEVGRAAVPFEDLVAERATHPALASARPPAGRVVLHGHCHQRALSGLQATRSALGAVGGALEVEAIDSTCCGMAGFFGYEAAHYDASLAMGGVRLFGRMRALSAREVAVAPGTSCREQIAHGAGVRALHPAEFLLDSIRRSAT